MDSVDALGSSLYFAAAANASRENQRSKDNSKVDKSKKSAFTNMVQREQELSELSSAGLPIEIAGLDEEASVVFLKDAIDAAADELEDNMTAENFTKFRKTVSQFLIYLEKNNFEVTKRKRFGETIIRGTGPFFMEKRKKDPYVQVHVVNQKLDEIAKMILQNHEDKLAMLSKVNEIKGMIVDFFAS